MANKKLTDQFTMKPAKTEKPIEMTVPLAKQVLSEEIVKLGLSARRLKFVAAYCTNGFNAMQALRQSGYNNPNKLTMNSWCYRILKAPDVVRAIQLFVDDVIAPYKANLELQVFQLYYKRAFYTVDMFFRSNGDVKPLDQIEADWLVVIDRIKKQTFPTKEGPVDSIEYVLADRDEALRTLLKFVVKFEGNAGNSPLLPMETQGRLAEIFALAQQEQAKLKVVNGRLISSNKEKAKTSRKRKAEGETVVAEFEQVEEQGSSKATKPKRASKVAKQPKEEDASDTSPTTRVGKRAKAASEMTREGQGEPSDDPYGLPEAF